MWDFVRTMLHYSLNNYTFATFSFHSFVFFSVLYHIFLLPTIVFLKKHHRTHFVTWLLHYLDYWMRGKTKESGFNKRTMTLKKIIFTCLYTSYTNNGIQFDGVRGIYWHTIYNKSKITCTLIILYLINRVSFCIFFITRAK